MAVGKRFLFCVIAVLLLCLSSAAMAADVSLAWDPSPSENISGYKVYIGSASGIYDIGITVGNQTSYKVTDLTSGTWYFVVTAFDGDGNESDFSNEVSHTVEPSIVDTTPPTIRGVTDSNSTRSSIIIHWNTNENSDSQIEYGTTASYGLTTTLDDSRVTSHSQEITGLSESTLYHYRVRSRDAAGNLAISGHYTFATAGAEDNTPPAISRVTTSDVTGAGATISWMTNEAADTQIEYGITEAYGNSTTVSGSLVKYHSQRIVGLTENTLYHFRVRSRDSSGNLAVSGDGVFTTGASGSAPVISHIEVSNITSRSALISWVTDSPANSQVEFRSADEAVRRSAIDVFVTNHSVALSGLKKQTLYTFRVLSTDLDGRLSQSSEYTFTTLENGSLVFVLPRFSEGQEGIQPGDEIATGIALTNFGSESADITFTARSGEGAFISGEDIANPVRFQLSEFQQYARLDTELFGYGLERSAPEGWIELGSSTSDVGGFYTTFDSKLSFMDGTELGDAPLTNLVLSEVEPDGYTRINIVNTNAEEAEAKIELMSADGAVRESIVRTIQGKGAFVAEVYGDLFGEMDPQASDYVRIRSASGLHAFQLMQEEGSDVYALAGQDAGNGATVLYSPQYAQGGPYHTALSLVNLESRAGLVEVQFVGEDGVQVGVTRVVEIPAHGKVYIEDPKFFQDFDLEVVTCGYVKVTGEVRLAGSTVFGDRNGKSLAAALPLIHSPKKSVLYSHVASSDLYYTGLAIVNINSEDVNAAVQLYAADGALTAETVLYLPAGQRKTKLLTEFFPSIEGQDLTSGYIRVISDRPLASFALFGTTNLSVLSAIPALGIQTIPSPLPGLNPR